MKKELLEPSFELVRFDGNVLTSSGDCKCVVAGIPMPNNETCNHNPECTCKTNYNPALDNCIPAPDQVAVPAGSDTAVAPTDFSL